VADKFGLAFIEGFVTETERRALVEVIDKHAAYLETSADLQWPNPPRRCGLSHLGLELVAVIEARIARALGVPTRFGEGLQGQIYGTGENYHRHLDAFQRGSPSFDREMPRAGQRPYSALIYLEVPRAGGATTFPNLGVTIHPTAGLAVFWSNLDGDHQPHRLSEHSSMPVLVGRKVIITSWYRERTYER
jgi:prolyl 4-hydroxylase